MEISSFDECVKKGGKVEEKRLRDGRYLRTCTDCNGAVHGQKPFRKKGKQNKNKNRSKNRKATTRDLVKLKEHFDINFRV